MKIFIVYAHPEPKSLNGTLKDVAVSHLESLGHEVIVSDLYKMDWKAVADKSDFQKSNPEERLRYMKSSNEAYHNGTQTEDIAKEQEKLLWADFIIFQFPFWWFGMPAILKGWIDRVYAFGFAYGTGKYGGKYWGNRYGEGNLQGKKAMLSITIGGREPQYQECGINGYIFDLLFPIHHGMLWYPGISVIPPNIIYQADSIDESRFSQQLNIFKNRLSTLNSTPIIPFRYQNKGDYDDEQKLRNELINGASGLSIHLNHNFKDDPKK
ncbi:flavodoxin family protein [Echinicola strongylocentroti]|uniref:Flavodoxin family protein n=1 Tax=Echinicola strongylocentroti TaxID=1795355 RepID=A0A2Z4IEP6_9BACT|nr:NAD(P)H-dependent oxidoreductase [Echinicola strongylocentroti]AWW29404.1 flavodoxin family protein [Echinicola strongylocentroti]